MSNEDRGTIVSLTRFCAASLIAGGSLAALLNLVLTPLLPIGEGSIAVATSTALGIRLPIAAASVVLTTPRSSVSRGLADTRFDRAQISLLEEIRGATRTSRGSPR